MTNIKEIVTDFVGQLQPRIGNALEKPKAATIGNPTDDSVYATGTNRSANTEVYIHLLTSDDPTSYTTALRGSFSRDDIYYGRPVTVTTNDAGDYVLYDTDSTRDAEFSVGIDQLDNQKPVYLKQVMGIGTLHPIAGSLKFRVTSGMFGEDYYSGADSADFSSGTVQDTTPANITIPTTNGQAKGVLVQLDATTGTLEYKQSSEFSAILSLAQAYKAGLLPLPDTDKYRLGYLKLVKGITQFSYDHIWEAPELLSKGSVPILNNFAATVAPTANEDSGDGYAVGSLWIDVTGGKAYICEDATLTAAVWIELVGTTLTQTLTNKILSQLHLLIGGFKAIFTHSNTVDRTYTLPDYDATLATLAGTENLSNKTFVDGVLIDGAADEIQLRVQGHGTQTAALASFEDSGGNVQLSIANNGAVIINDEANGPTYALRVKNEATTDSNTRALVIQGTDGRMGIGNDPDTDLLVDITPVADIITGNPIGAVGLPDMTTTHRELLAPRNGAILFDTDLQKFFGRADSDWNPFAFDGVNGIPFTDPTAQTWTALNQGGGTYTEDTTNKRMTILEDGDGSLDVRGWYFTAPSVPYVATFFVEQIYPFVSTNCAGVFFRENATGELHSIMQRYDGTNNLTLNVAKWNSATSFNSSYISSDVFGREIRWFRLADNNTNRIISVSPDGIVWTVIHTIGRTDFLTADELGFGAILLTNATYDTPVSLLSLELT